MQGHPVIPNRWGNVVTNENHNQVLKASSNTLRYFFIK